MKKKVLYSLRSPYREQLDVMNVSQNCRSLSSRI